MIYNIQSLVGSSFNTLHIEDVPSFSYNGNILWFITNSDSSNVGMFTHDGLFGKRIAVSTAPEHAKGPRHTVVPTVTSTGSVTVQSVATSNRWRFSGKENQSCLSAGISLLDFGARMCNPSIARWTASDLMVWLFRVSQH